MTTKQATARYFWIFGPAMTIFLIATVVTVWLDDTPLLSRTALIGLSLVPVAALLCMFWAHWRFMHDLDEFLRMIQLKALLFAAMVVMVIATGWGYMELSVDMPAMPIFWLNPMFWAAYGLAAAFHTKRDGGTFL